MLHLTGKSRSPDRFPARAFHVPQKTNMTPDFPSDSSSNPIARVDHRVVAHLLQAVAELNSTPDLDAGLDRVADCLGEHLKFDSFGVLLLGDLGRELRFRYARGYPPEVLEHWRFGMGQGLVGTVASSGKPERVGDVSCDFRNCLPASRCSTVHEPPSWPDSS